MSAHSQYSTIFPASTRKRSINRAYPGYLALELGSTLSSSLALAISDLQQGIQAHLDALLSAYWPHSTSEQRQLPLLVSYRLFLALHPLALQGDEELQRAIVREMKVVLYRYWEPIMGKQRASEVRSHETPVPAEEQGQRRDPSLFDRD